ncbi:MAG: hypothetical protein IIC23_05195 [Chloroflexi bacterium]|nr:hypothetical protein [Chloroflexota bacterium]
MPGKKNSHKLQPKDVIYYYDECLPPPIGEVLSSVGFNILMPDKGVKDEDLIPLLGKRRFVWITKDDRAKSEHETLLRDANISVVWIRGLSHDRKKSGGSMQRTAGSKDILRMLVNKLDDISAQIADAKGRPVIFCSTPPPGQRTLTN